MRKIISLLLLGVVIAGLLTSCDSRPSMVLSKEDTAQLLADIHEAEGMADQNYTLYQTDSMKRVLRQAVYEKHGVDQQQVDSTLAWYGYHMDKFKDVYDRVNEILEKRLSQLQVANVESTEEVDPSTAMYSDSLRIWRTNNPLLFSSRFDRQLFTKVVERDHNWKPGDTYLLKYKTVGQFGRVSVNMTATYGDDVNKSVFTTESMEGWHKLYLDTDTANTASTVNIVIQSIPNAMTKGIVSVDSVSLVRVRRNRPD